MLPGGDIKKVCPVFAENPSRQWYCQMPKTAKNCSEYIYNQGVPPKKLKSRLLNNLRTFTDKYHLDQVYEDLVFEKTIEVENEMPENEEFAASFTKSTGYWNQGIWKDDIYPPFGHSVLTPEMMSNKMLVVLGGSICRHITEVLLQKNYLDFLESNFTATVGRFDFLGLEKYKQPECVPADWGEPQWGPTRLHIRPYYFLVWSTE